MKRILIIEDEQDIVDITTLILEKEGYQVDSLNDFSNYEEKISSYDADLILLDLNLGIVNGKEICEYIKSQPHLKHKAVVLMSANFDVQKVKEEAGANSYLRKPFELSDFLYVVRFHTNTFNS